MRLQTLTGLIAALTASTATAQLDASSRLHAITSTIKRAPHDVETGQVRPFDACEIAEFALYNNSCTPRAYLAMNPGEVFTDTGQLAGTRI